MSDVKENSSLEENVRVQLRKGVLEYCILSILARGDSYAPRIIAELKGSEMIVVEGTIYPLLTRQKNSGLLDYRWEESTQGPPRKVYSLTPKGQQTLELLDTAWQELTDQISRLRRGANN
ncbi:MAG: PadR family transcriptional regulator [Rikenellaceae bacterium]